jgi:hypothetical protein
MASRDQKLEDTKGVIWTGMTDNIKEQKTKTLHRADLATQAPLNTEPLNKLNTEMNVWFPEPKNKLNIEMYICCLKLLNKLNTEMYIGCLELLNPQ